VPTTFNGATFNGDVGIGTTIPEAQLHIGPKNNDHIYLASLNNDYGWKIDTEDQSAGDVPFRIIKRLNDVDTTVLTIKNQDGNVGIGTTSPTDKLHVNGSLLIQHDTIYETSSTAGWYKIGVWDPTGTTGARLKIRFLGMEGYSAQTGARGGETILYASCNNNIPSTVANMSGIIHAHGPPAITEVKFVHLDGSRHKFEIRAYVKTFVKMSMSVECNQTDSFTKFFTASTDPGVDSAIVGSALFSHVFDNSGNVGIGEDSPTQLLHVRGAGPQLFIEGASNEPAIIRGSSGPSYRDKYHEIAMGFYAISGFGTSNYIDFKVNEGGESNSPSTRMRIRGDGNVGIGTTDPDAKLHINSSSGADGIAIFNPAGGTGGTLALSSGVRGGILISNSGGGSNLADGYSSQPIVLSGGGTAATDGDLRGGSIWSKWGGSQYGLGFKGANDGDAVPEGASAPTLFVTADKVGIGTTTPDTTLHIINPSTTTDARQYGLHIGGKGADIVPIINAGSGGLTVETVAGIEITSIDSNISGHGRHALIESVSAGSTYNTDIEFRARGGVGYTYSRGSSPAQKQARIAHNGYIYARVGTSATGADYAELFEWDDGNPENEDRTGMTVKLMEGGKICITDANTSPNAVIGVISAIYGFLGNNHWDEWVGKYLKDSLGRVVTETVDMVTWRDEDDKEHTFTINTIPDDIEVPETATYYQDTDVPKLNPKHDKTLKYTERGKRKEWGAVGLVGRLRVLKTYPKSSRWVKLQDIDSEVEEYLAV
jgi:hypothetical protein